MKCRKLSRILFYYGAWQVACFVLALIIPLVDIIKGNTDTSKWFLPLMLLVPFDISTVSGWLWDWHLQFHIAIGYNGSAVLTSSHFACFCCYIVAMCDHFELVVESLRVDYGRIQMEKNTGKHPYMWCKAREKLQRCIEMHVNIYE